MAGHDLAAEREWIRERALSLGFDGVGFARAPDPGEPMAEGVHLSEWLERGYAADMAWLGRAAARRADPRRMLPEIRSVVVLTASYCAGTPEPEPGEGRVAAYARGRDYHNVLGPRARKLLFAILARHPGADGLSFVDRSAVLEKAWAVRAGLGWMGKNTLVMNRERGSRFLLAVIFLTLDLEPSPAIEEQCGECRLCLDACPTSAFPEPFVLDARRCISYLTIETRGEIAPQMSERMGDWLFGCDVCQDVCPYNRAPLSLPAPELPLHESLAGLLALDEAGIAAYARGRPLARAGRIGLIRNACIVAGNSRDGTLIPLLSALLTDVSEVIRSASRRALDRLTPLTRARTDPGAGPGGS